MNLWVGCPAFHTSTWIRATSVFILNLISWSYLHTLEIHPLESMIREGLLPHVKLDARDLSSRPHGRP